MKAIVEVYISARRSPLRTALTLFGIALGSFLIVTLVSILHGAGEAFARVEQEASGKNVTRIDPVPVPERHVGTTTIELDERDARALQQHEGLTESEVVARYELPSLEAFAAGRTMQVAVSSGGVAALHLAQLEVLHGRWPETREDGERVCVLGYDVWNRLFGGEWPLSRSTIRLAGHATFKVIGVAASRPSLGGGGEESTWQLDRKVWIGTRAFLRTLDSAPPPPSILVQVNDRNATVDAMRETAYRLLPFVLNRHRGVQNFQFGALEEEDPLPRLFSMALSTLLGLAALVCVITGGINLLSAQLASVADRAREFAIRRTLGMTARAVMWHVVFESIVLALVGSVVGCAAGAAFAWLACAALTKLVTAWAYVVVPWAFALSIVASMIVGLLSGLAPALRAARLAPAECLRAD